MSLRAQYLILADSVQDVQSGKLNILGVFEQIYLREVPSRFQGFIAVTFIVAETEDGLGRHQISCEVLRPNDQSCIQAGAALDFKPTGGGGLSQARIVIQLRNIPFYEYGRHRVVIRVDGQEVAGQPLLVTPPPASQPQ